jgi:two-component system chemotaxis sensor kinase CheA
MSVDMTQFHDVLFEECLEHLDIMKKEIDTIDYNAFDFEKLNTIYRGAHTIKGGCAMLEFNTESVYAKKLEHIFMAIRDKTTPLTPENIAVLSEAVEFLRAMIVTLQGKGTNDEAKALAHLAKTQAAIV